MKKITTKYYEAHLLAKEVDQILNSENIDQNISPHIINFLNENRYASEFINNITDEENIQKACEEIKSEQRNKEQNIKLLLGKISKRSRKTRILSLVKRVASSVAILFITFGIWKSISLINQDVTPTQSVNNSLNIISPTLIMGNGETVELKNQDIVTENYKIKSSDEIQDKKSNTTINNRIIVPCRNRISVVLEDGTVVFLNGSSELVYPNKFTGDSRTVELKGEAYFSVTKSDVPFIVKANDVNVRVYGTEFNINTNKSNRVETILVTGSVGVNTPMGEVMIKPNQMVTYNSENKTSIITNITNTEQRLSWRNGYLSYKMASLKDVLDDVSAWYGVKFIYNVSVDNMKIELSVSRNRPIEELLAAIEDMLEIKFIKEGGSIYTVDQTKNKELK